MAGVTSKVCPSTHSNWVVALLCLLPLSATSSAAETVQSLRYGASLYHYYQRDYFGALTELTAAQKLDALGPHTDGAELLRGGMALSYGMDRQAESIFRQQLAQAGQLSADSDGEAGSETENEGDNAYASVNADQVWFYLGKMAWQRGDAQRTAQSLNKMDAQYAGDLEKEAQYLSASAALALGDAEAAEAQLTDLPEHSRWRQYLGYNLGATHAARGDWLAATPYFSAIAAQEPESPEARALHDKSLTAAGFAYLSGGEYEQSGSAFRQVRLDGPYSTRALLGYGWSAAERGDYLAALSPWQQLAERSMLDESARESLLAVPYAYDQLGRPGLALHKYRLASAAYQEELTGLDQAITAFAEEPLGPLLGIAEEGSADWLFDTDILPEGDHSPYLQHLVTRHSFQVALRELRDLYSIAGHLERAQQRMQVLQEVNSHQQQVWSSLVEEDRRNRLAAQAQALGERQQALRAQLQAAIAQQDGRLLADQAQTARWERLDRAAQVAVNIHSSGKHAGKYTDKLALLRGLLIWEDNEQYAERAWQARKDIAALDALAVESAIALNRVDAAIDSRDQADFAPRITSLTEQVQNQAAQVALTLAQSENHLRQVAINELQRQGEQLTRALGQSQLAIAQIHDRAGDYAY